MASTASSLLPGVYSRFYRWARRTSAFADSLISGWEQEEPEEPDAGNAMMYRLRRWPDLPDAHRTAPIYRMLSVMSTRPVNRNWILANSRMQPRQLDGLLAGLVAQGVVEAISVAGLVRH